MSNTPTPPLVSSPDDEPRPDAPLREVDGEQTLDPDADPERIDSAAADRLDAQHPKDEEGADG